MFYIWTQHIPPNYCFPQLCNCALNEYKLLVDESGFPMLQYFCCLLFYSSPFPSSQNTLLAETVHAISQSISNLHHFFLSILYVIKKNEKKS